MEKKLRTPFAAILIAVSILLSILSFTPISMRFFGHRQLLGASSILPVVIDIVLCYTLFAKKRNTLMVAALACYTIPPLLAIVRSLPSLNINSILILAAYFLLFLIATATCDDSKIKLPKLEKSVIKLYALPGLLVAINTVITVFRFIRGEADYNYIIYKYTTLTLSCISTFSIAYWLTKSPEAKTDGGIIKALGIKPKWIVALVVILILLIINLFDTRSEAEKWRDGYLGAFREYAKYYGWFGS